MDFHLLIPDLLQPSTHDPHFPALAALLARGSSHDEPEGDMESWLCRAFDVNRQADWPTAPFSLLADGGIPGKDYWLCADPVTVQLVRNQLILFADDDIAPSTEEAGELCAALNQHFAADDLHFSAPHPRRWYLRLPVAQQLLTHPLARVNGRDISHFLPDGADSSAFRKLLNEAQMLLHAHPLNAARETAGLPPVNSIWPWGGGVLQESLARPYAQVFADNALARGLALQAGAEIRALPADVSACLQADGGDLLVVLDALRSTTPQGLPARQAQLAHLEANWFVPLKQALRKGLIQSLTLTVPGMTRITLKRVDLIVPAGIGKLLRRVFARKNITHIRLQ